MSEDYMEKKPKRKYEVSKPVETEVRFSDDAKLLIDVVHDSMREKLKELYEQRPIITGGETPRILEEKRKELEQFYQKLLELV